MNIFKQSDDVRDFERAVKRRIKALPAVDHVINATNAVRSVINSPIFRRTVDTVRDLTSAVSAVVEKPTPYTIVRSTLDVCKVIMAAAEVDPDNYFDGDEWAVPYASEFNRTIIAVLSRMPHRVLATTRPGMQIMTVDLDGCKVAWMHDRLVFDRPTEHVYVESSKIDEARTRIREALWHHFADKSIVLKRRRTASYSGTDSYSYTFEQDDNDSPLPSGTSRDLSAYLDRAISGGFTRSLLLWGAPGTGKTSLARAVVATLGLRCLRLRVEDLGRLQNSTLTEAINVFAPEAVIIDDLDRIYGGQEHMFEMLTTLKKRVKLFLGTCNNKKKVPAALRRPGRFDERRRIDVIDHEVVRAMLGVDFADAFDTVKDWPIVYVEEYVVRRRFQAPEELKETIRELKECMKELRDETSDKVAETTDEEEEGDELPDDMENV